MLRLMRISLCALFLVAAPVFAEAQLPPASKAGTEDAATNASAHAVIEGTTERVMKAIGEAKGYYDTDPERLYSEIGMIMDDVVDFKSFARGVMGKYGSKKYYQQLKTDEEKQQFKARVDRFSDVFKTGLVRTYAKGLLTFNGNKIEVKPPKESDKNKASVNVVQLIHGSDAQPFVVQYKLKQDKQGEWKLRNVTIEAINLGKVYQSQFKAAVKENKGDVDKVIETWSIEPKGISSDKKTEV